MRIAMLADIHGNLPALEAIAVRLEQLQPDFVIVNGDLINSTPFSPQVIDFVRQRGWAVVRGNHEFYYLDFGSERARPEFANLERWGMLHWLVRQISVAQGAWLAMLPDDLKLYLPGTQGMHITHGVPGRNRVGFIDRHSDEHIAQEISAVTERTLITAHTHVQLDRQVLLPARSAEAGAPSSPLTTLAPRTCHVINPGSIGNPMNGDPSAQFAILEPVAETVAAGGWQASMVRVAYDRRLVLEAFTSSGMMAEGGVIGQLFYWELVTSEPEILRYLRWCKQNGYDPDGDIKQSFCLYAESTGRAQYVRERDPLFANKGRG